MDERYLRHNWNVISLWASASPHSMFWANNYFLLPTQSANPNPDNLVIGNPFSYLRPGYYPYENGAQYNFSTYSASPSLNQFILPPHYQHFHAIQGNNDICSSRVIDTENISDMPHEPKAISSVRKLGSTRIVEKQRSLETQTVSESPLPTIAGETPTISVLNKSSVAAKSKENKKIRYRCRFCEKPFSWFSHWQAHERIHTGERPFKCNTCQKAFTRSDGLKCHQITHLMKKGQTSRSQIKQKFSDQNLLHNQKYLPQEAIGAGTQFAHQPQKGILRCFRDGKNTFTTNGLQHPIIHDHKGKGII